MLRFVDCALRDFIFGATNLHEIFIWLDASYSLHHDMKSHTGGVMSMGLGVTYCRLSKQNLNTNRST